MDFLVSNCYHWIGFHLVNKLLEEGYAVDGIVHPGFTNDHLSMYLGRNSSFQEVNSLTDKSYHTTFIVAGEPVERNIGKRVINLICGDNETDNHVTIKLPLLYGKWMPMDEQGIYDGNDYVPFDSERFLENALSVESFIKSLVSWAIQGTLPTDSNQISLNNKKLSNKMMKHAINLHKNERMDKQVKQLRDHYQRFKVYYKT